MPVPAPNKATLPAPSEYVRAVMHRQLLRGLACVSVVATAFALTGFGGIGAFVGAAFGGLCMNPLMGLSVKTWEWTLSVDGVFLRNVNNPVNFYGYPLLQWKNDALVGVERSAWRGLPALTLTFLRGRRKACKTLKIVYNPADESSVTQTLLPLLQARLPQTGG